MKKATVLLLVLLLTVFTAACASAPAVQATPVPEAPAAPALPAQPDSPVLPDATDVPAALDEDALAWPEGDAGQRIPLFNGGSLDSMLDNGDNCTVTVANGTEADYDAYVADLKEAGFTSDANEVKEASMHMYSASSEDNYYASVALSDGQIVISAEFLG